MRFSITEAAVLGVALLSIDAVTTVANAAPLPRGGGSKSAAHMGSGSKHWRRDVADLSKREPEAHHYDKHGYGHRKREPEPILHHVAAFLGFVPKDQAAQAP